MFFDSEVEIYYDLLKNDQIFVTVYVHNVTVVLVHPKT
jgi:hypothetical protein